MNVLSLLRDLFFPPACPGCGLRMPPNTTSSAIAYFCSDCAKKWERSLLKQCPECFAAYCDCRCQPKVMERAGCAGLVKLAPYRHEGETVVIERVVLGMKDHPRDRYFACCAEALAPLVKDAIQELEENTPISHTVIGYLPRSARKVRHLGFDQAREIAKKLAAYTGLPFCRVLVRVKDGAPQKSLTLQARQANVKGAFACKGSVKGLRVLLVDDLVTTGAGMAEGARTLLRNGAAQVLAVSVAVTPKAKTAKG